MSVAEPEVNPSECKHPDPHPITDEDNIGRCPCKHVVYAPTRKWMKDGKAPANAPKRMRLQVLDAHGNRMG